MIENNSHPNMENQDQISKQINNQISEQSIKELLDKNGYILHELNFNSDSAGTINHIYFIKAFSKESYDPLSKQNKISEFVLRISNSHIYWQGIKTEHEVSILNFINKYKNSNKNTTNSLKIPSVIDYQIQPKYDLQNNDTSQIKPEYILMNKIPGILLSDYKDQYWNQLNQQDQIQQSKNILEQGYSFLQQLKQIPFKKDKICGFDQNLQQTPINWDGPSLGPYESLQEFLLNNIYWFKKEVKNLNKQEQQLFKEIVLFMENLINLIKNDKFETDFQINYEFCHNDLHSGNILIDPETQQITGYLDWEHSKVFPYVSDFKEYDLLDAWFHDLKENQEMQDFQDQQLYNKNILNKEKRKIESKKEEIHLILFSTIMQANWLVFYVASWWKDIKTEEKIKIMTNYRYVQIEEFIEYINKHNKFWPEFTLEKTMDLVKSIQKEIKQEQEQKQDDNNNEDIIKN